MDNMLVFKDGDMYTKIRYVIAYFSEIKGNWYHYLDFPDIDTAKLELEKAKKRKPNVKYGLFEKIEQKTINQLTKDFI